MQRTLARARKHRRRFRQGFAAMQLVVFGEGSEPWVGEQRNEFFAGPCRCVGLRRKLEGGFGEGCGRGLETVLACSSLRISRDLVTSYLACKVSLTPVNRGNRLTSYTDTNKHRHVHSARRDASRFSLSPLLYLSAALLLATNVIDCTYR